jgi:Arc/MetJ-type ribon-helix-helix transcriptional regulator
MAKRPISATIDEELIKWLDSEIKEKKKYRNKSHLIEIALEKLKEDETRR